nr:hypothetical protein [Tanacetum cinerariifolium]
MSIKIEKITKKKELRKREQAANLSTYTAEPSRRFSFICYDDDDEERTIPLSDIISSSIVIIASPLVLPIEDPKDFLIIGNEDLNTILEKESDEVIKSNVEDLVPIPIEFEDTSESDSECDFPACDDFSPTNVLEDIESKASYDSNLNEPALLVTPLFDSNEDECFDPGGDVDEITAFDIPLDFEDGYYDSKEMYSILRV